MPVTNIAQKYYYFDMCLIKSYTQIAMILIMIITFMSLQKKTIQMETGHLNRSQFLRLTVYCRLLCDESKWQLRIVDTTQKISHICTKLGESMILNRQQTYFFTACFWSSVARLHHLEKKEISAYINFISVCWPSLVTMLSKIF